MTASRVAFGVAVLIAQIAPALADDGCNKFAWPLTRERTLLAASDKSVVKSGDTLASIPNDAFTLQLQPGPEATFVMPPERKPRIETWFGGAVRFPALAKAGIYQITLSDEAWLDVVQDARFARSVGSTGRSDCPGLRKSVRLDLSAKPFVLQFSGVPSNTITIVIGAGE